MKWTATISLKSGDYITIKDLKSVDRKNPLDSSIEKIQDFKSFHLPKGQLLFVGEKDIVTINSSEIKYVQFAQS